MSFLQSKTESHPLRCLDMEWIQQGHTMDMAETRILYLKMKCSIQHNALLILKHPDLTGNKFSMINQPRKHNHSEGDYKIYGQILLLKIYKISKFSKGQSYSLLSESPICAINYDCDIKRCLYTFLSIFFYLAFDVPNFTKRKQTKKD